MSTRRKSEIAATHAQAVFAANYFIASYQHEREANQAAIEHITQCELYIHMLEDALRAYLPEAFE